MRKTHVKKTPGSAPEGKPIAAMADELGAKAEYLLLVGRWHGVTKDQERSLKRALKHVAGKLVFVITADGQGGTKRHPLYSNERKLIAEGFAKKLGRPYEIHAAADIPDSVAWTAHICDVVKSESGGETVLTPDNTVLVTSNADVFQRFQSAGYRAIVPDTSGKLPIDMLQAMAARGDWRSMATKETGAVFESHDVEQRVITLYSDLLLNEDGELSHGRDFAVYSQGMDASMSVKIQDICPWIIGGYIVDKGCGTGTLLIHLSTLHPKAQIVGMDMSRDLLRRSEGQHYPNHNVAVVMGNIIHKRFADATVSTIIFSSVMHEVYSYNGYDREQIRLALKNAWQELQVGGRVIIRDGVKPKDGDRLVWLRCKDSELEERFRKFAREFKGKSANPGFAYDERVFDGVTHFRLTLHEANEFLSKKDYLANWAMEVNEEFGVWTTDEWREEFTALGFNVLHSESYLNPWIEENRYEGHCRLYADNGGERGGPGELLPFPDTTGVIVAEKVVKTEVEAAENVAIAG
ncbi:MAG: methyltransferase domain-containing protein [Candidatus Melainabacteria bacterium]|jgi:SAM-dependent methyltransferase|nr:methyltransferase domain-containing protein [Candidatus Melainabacteria bacterium]